MEKESSLGLALFKHTEYFVDTFGIPFSYKQLEESENFFQNSDIDVKAKGKIQRIMKFL